MLICLSKLGIGYMEQPVTCDAAKICTAWHTQVTGASHACMWAVLVWDIECLSQALSKTSGVGVGGFLCLTLCPSHTQTANSVALFPLSKQKTGDGRFLYISVYLLWNRALLSLSNLNSAAHLGQCDSLMNILVRAEAGVMSSYTNTVSCYVLPGLVRTWEVLWTI